MRLPKASDEAMEEYYRGKAMTAQELIDKFVKDYDLAEDDQTKLDTYDELIKDANVNRCDLWWRMAREAADARDKK